VVIWFRSAVRLFSVSLRWQSLRGDRNFPMSPWAPKFSPIVRGTLAVHPPKISIPPVRGIGKLWYPKIPFIGTPKAIPLGVTKISKSYLIGTFFTHSVMKNSLIETHMRLYPDHVC